MSRSSNSKPTLNLSGFDIKDAGPAGGTGVVRHLLIAVAVTIALYLIPYVQFVTYPLRMMVTFIHEGSHALATVLTGGLVSNLLLQPDASGVTLSRGGFGLAISPAGYLGATLYGALLIAALRRGVAGRKLLLITGGIIAALTLLCVRPWPLLPGYTPLNFLWTAFWGVAISAGLIIAGRKLSEPAAAGFAAFLGVQCVLNALFDLKTLFDLSVTTLTPTDAQNMARMTLIPAPIWASLWIATAVVMLWAVLIHPRFKAKRAVAAVR